MSTITTRSGKGSPLTNNEVDNNFTNLNTDKAELSGATFTGEIVANAGIALGDNDKATFGAGDGLQIYHDPTGPANYISDIGSGDLVIKGSNQIRLQQADGDALATFNENSSVQLYHDNNLKLATTSTGIDVTGTATMDGLTVDGTLVAPPVIRINNTGGAWTVGDEAGRLQFYTTDSTGIGAREVASIRSTTNQGGNTTDGTLEFWTSPYNTVAKKSMEIDGRTGDISFYEDTGTTPKLFWDASAESLGIGTSSPSSILDLGSDTNTSQEIRISGGRASLGYDTTKGTSGAVVIQGSANKAIHFENTADTSAMVIDSSGSVGIGTSSPDTLMHLSGDATAILRLENTNAGLALNSVIGGIEFEKQDASGAGAGVAGSVTMISDNSNGAETALTFGTSSTARGNNAEAMRVSGTGNVGIGTSSPSEALHVKDLSEFLVDVAASDSAAEFKSNLGNSWRIGNDSSLNAFAITQAASLSTDVRFFIANGGNVGIGTSSPSQKLDVSSAGTTRIQVKNTNLTSAGLYIAEDSNGAQFNELGAYPMRFHTNGTERVRIGASGNLLVGTTSADPAATSQNTVGTAIGASGYLSMTRDDAVSAFFNRKTSDGSIAEFRKDGTTVGSIGSVAGGYTMYNSESGTGYLGVNGAATYAWDATKVYHNTDATGDLGLSNRRFKDAYLSGGVYLGGTGAANKLDDYETGTWAVAVFDASSGGNESATAVNGYYTKIGNLVHCNFIMNNIDTSGLTGANPIYWSLPFGVASTENALGQVTGNFNNGSIVQVHPYAAQNSGRIFLLTHKDNGNEGFIVVSDFSDDSDDVIISLSYRTS